MTPCSRIRAICSGVNPCSRQTSSLWAPSAGPARYLSRAQTARHCFWEERPEGHLVNRESGLPFSISDPCVVRGATIGSDPAAYRQALQAVKALVGTAARPQP